MNRYRRQVLTVAGAIGISPPLRIEWCDRRWSIATDDASRRVEDRSAREAFHATLTSLLYRGFYCRGGRPGPPLPVGRRYGTGRRDHVARLSAANVSRGCWDPGWRVVAKEADEIVVRKHGLTLRVERSECDPRPDGGIGDDPRVRVRMPREYLNRSPGFFVIPSDTEFEDGPRVRLYWNVDSEGAVELVRHVTRWSRETGLPSLLKVCDNPASFARCDTVVLFVPRRDLERVPELIGELSDRLEGHLGPAVPGFTLPLARGVGLAEDPVTGESFGDSRCRLLTGGILRAHESGRSSPADVLVQVERCFAEAGLRLDKPYRNNGSETDYSCLLEELPSAMAG